MPHLPELLSSEANRGGHILHLSAVAFGLLVREECGVDRTQLERRGSGAQERWWQPDLATPKLN